MIRLFFTPKTVYGQTLFYPDCEATRNLATLAKRKSFDKVSLSLLNKTYCFEVVVNQPEEKSVIITVQNGVVQDVEGCDNYQVIDLD